MVQIVHDRIFFNLKILSSNLCLRQYSRIYDKKFKRLSKIREYWWNQFYESCKGHIKKIVSINPVQNGYDYKCIKLGINNG